jgi:uncharacterized damage-inducible protein DinB
MKLFFRELLEYGHHFNQELGTVFIDNPDKTSEKAIKLYNHILNSHHIWNSRIENRPAGIDVWELHPMGNLKQMDQMNYEQSLLILDKFDLNDVITYTNTKGLSFTNQVRDILFHITNHSTYHRAQIGTEFKLHNLTPLTTDYISYKR